MKSEKEIRERIEDVRNAMVDCDDRGNQVEANKLANKIKALEWVIE